MKVAVGLPRLSSTLFAHEARVGRNRRDIAERLHETLQEVGAPVLGVIANGVKARGPGSYAYAYSYDYAPAKSGRSSEPASPDTGPSAGEPSEPPPSKVEA